MESARPALNLARRQSVYQKGDITIYMTWMWNDDLDDSEPTLVMVPRYRALGKPCGIALSAAYMYNDPQYCACRCHEFVVTMGFEPSITMISRVMDIIMDHMDELVSMPPEPMTEVVVADGVITDQDGNKKSVELLEHQRR